MRWRWHPLWSAILQCLAAQHSPHVSRSAAAFITTSAPLHQMPAPLHVLLSCTSTMHALTAVLNSITASRICGFHRVLRLRSGDALHTRYFSYRLCCTGQIPTSRIASGKPHHCRPFQRLNAGKSFETFDVRSTEAGTWSTWHACLPECQR